MPRFDSLTPPELPDDPMAQRNSRSGLILFTIYSLVYGTFVILNAFWPAVMNEVPFAGLNLAILYGLGLIVMALVLAALYGWLCRSPEASK